MRIITAKELKNRTGAILRQVRAGESMIVTVRGERVAQFVPVTRNGSARAARDDRQSRRALIRSVAGKYRGLGTVEEFLREKIREIAVEQ